MMSSIVLIPALWAVYMARVHSLPWSFINVYLPVLLWFPTIFNWKIPGLPDPGFAEMTAALLMLIFIQQGRRGGYFSFNDVLVLCFALLTGVSEYYNHGYKPAQNVIANMLLSVMFPYFLTKSLIEQNDLRINAAKSIVIVLFVIALLMIPEIVFRSKYTIWQRVLGRFFGEGWTQKVTPRWGLSRAQGPFVHPIMAGMIMVIGFRLQRWLEWNQAWPAKIKGIKLPIARIITLVLLAGIIVTFSRGPWLSGIIAAAMIFTLGTIIKFAKQPVQRYLIVGGLIIGMGIGGLVAQEIVQQLVPTSREESVGVSREQQTIAYRFDLYRTYGAIVLEKWALGWGVMGWPQDKSQWSIDNGYLLLALSHGLIVLGSFIILIFYLIIRLFIYTMHQRSTSPPQNDLALTFLSLLVATVVYMATVSIGGHTEILLFILFGWSDAYLHLQPFKRAQPQMSPKLHQSRMIFNFQRIM